MVCVRIQSIVSPLGASGWCIGRIISGRTDYFYAHFHCKKLALLGGIINLYTIAIQTCRSFYKEILIDNLEPTLLWSSC